MRPRAVALPALDGPAVQHEHDDAGVRGVGVPVQGRDRHPLGAVQAHAGQETAHTRVRWKFWNERLGVGPR